MRTTVLAGQKKKAVNLNFPLYIAKRYLRSKSSQNAVNIINLITFIVPMIIGSAALLLSGFAGLKTFSLSFSNAYDHGPEGPPGHRQVF